MRHTRVLGKVAYTAAARRNACELEWELLEVDGGRLRFSGSAAIWNATHTDCVACGQCVAEVCELFPDDPFARRFLEVWRAWHLNDMHAGTPAQEAALAPVRGSFGWRDAYGDACAFLESVGLLEDPAEGGYRYGSAWLYREIPAEIVAEIRGWSA